MVCSLHNFARTENGLESPEWVVGPPPHEDLLAYFYLQAKKAGVLARLFYQGVPDLRWFLDYLQNYIVIGCYRRRILDGAEAVELVGVGFAKCDPMGKFSKAEVNFCFLPGLAEIHEQIALGRAMAQFLFDKYGYDSLLGTTPAKNRAALAYARRVGFKLHGPIEDYCTWDDELCPVYISQLSRARFEAQHGKREE